MPASLLIRFRWVFVAGLLGATVASAAETVAPISLHPENGRYFLWRGQPTVLITSGEHYGALLNLDFDFERYFAALAADGLNHTRTFSGAYRESPKSFGITDNTLAPKPDRFACPWPRSDQPGSVDGGNKFDLSRFDDAYFARLHQFMAAAQRHGIVVEMNLFCPLYEDVLWDISPMHIRNNINGVGDCPRTEVYTLKHPALTAVQEALTRKIVTELNRYDNLYYEVCNEPYFGGVTLAWQHRIADVIAETEKALGVRHLISQNVANDKAKVENPHPAVSIFNFHYAYPPDTVAMNYGLNKIIGDNETGFRGTNDLPYRVEAWSFLLAGGGLFNHLDYSFVAGHEDGTFVYPASQPGGGNPVFRRQMKILGDFLRGFDFIRMKPAADVIAGGVPAGHRAYALAEPGKACALYLARDTKDKNAPTGPQAATLQLHLPAGAYTAEWVNPRTGQVDKRESIRAAGDITPLASPAFEEDVALRLRRS